LIVAEAVVKEEPGFCLLGRVDGQNFLHKNILILPESFYIEMVVFKQKIRQEQRDRLSPMKLKTSSALRISLAALHLFLGAALLPAQTEKATLILQGGEEIACQIKRVSHGYVYFDAATKSLTFKYGDFIEIEKIVAVRLGDGRTLTMNEFLTSRGYGQPTTSTSHAEPAPQQPSGPGLRLPNRLLDIDTSQAKSPIGLRMPSLPPPLPAPAELNYNELADLLAEAGLVGRMLNEINSGALAGRVLTKSQKELVNAIDQSPIWIARKNALREAQRVATAEFKTLTQRRPDWLEKEFHFQSVSRDHVFEEFVQFLQTQNVLHFQDEWQQIETLFGADAAAALRDILTNYDDWLFLFGEALEKR
jgi:hypothetical protein